VSRAAHDVLEVDPGERDAAYARHLPQTEVLISQQPMGADRLVTLPPRSGPV
jgi:hypothetical protein